jgi:hypothetical protein
MDVRLGAAAAEVAHQLQQSRHAAEIVFML